jgi:hypothetical protein
MNSRHGKSRLLVLAILAVFLASAAYLGRGYYRGAKTIHQLLTDNKKLKKAIANLTHEEQIGYAKVLDQQIIDGKLFTTLKFVETARDNKLKKILEKQYTIEGDIVHFDALIVKFHGQMVMDGRTRALYLWRRVYGEKMAPQEGFPIERPGTEPQRYSDLLEALPIEHCRMFWSNIWDLANDQKKLMEYGIEAVYGNVVYTKLTKGLIYVFNIDATGQVTPKTVPDI